MNLVIITILFTTVICLVCAGTLKTASEADEQAEQDFLNFMENKKDTK